MMVPHSRPTLGDTEAAAAAEAVRSGHVAVGPQTAEFERELARTVGVGGAVATSSGTAALYAALKALGVGDGSEVIVPSFVCTALVHATWATGATPVVCDVGDGANLSPESAGANLTSRTAAIIVPHMFGRPTPIEPFLELGPPVIEDCAQSLGAAAGRAGACAVFSFYATKMIATGEGGAVASDSDELLDNVRDLIEYDKKFDARRRFNLKFNDVAAAIGWAQLARLDGFVARRREIAGAYTRRLADLPEVALPDITDSACFRYVVEVTEPQELIDSAGEAGVVLARPVTPPLHRVVGGSCPESERLFHRAVSLPIYPSLGDAEVGRVVEAVRRTLNRSGGG